MKHLLTQRLQLWSMTLSDAAVVGNMYQNQAATAPYEVEPLNTLTEQQVFVSRIISESNAIWTIRLSSQPNKIIGDCTVHHYNPAQKSIEIGGTLKPEYWGKGLMAEAFSEIMQYAIKRYELTCFVAVSSKQNSRAIRFAQKIGFVVQAEREEEVV